MLTSADALNDIAVGVVVPVMLTGAEILVAKLSTLERNTNILGCVLLPRSTVKLILLKLKWQPLLGSK